MTYVNKEDLLQYLRNTLETEAPALPESWVSGFDDAYRGLIESVEEGRFDVEAAPESIPEPIKLAVDGNIVAESYTGSSVTPLNTLPHNYTKDVLEALLEASEDFYDASEIQALLKGAIQAIPKGKGVIL